MRVRPAGAASTARGAKGNPPVRHPCSSARNRPPARDVSSSTLHGNPYERRRRQGGHAPTPAAPRPAVAGHAGFAAFIPEGPGNDRGHGGSGGGTCLFGPTRMPRPSCSTTATPARAGSPGPSRRPDTGSGAEWVERAGSKATRRAAMTGPDKALRQQPRSENPASHRDGRGARLTRREEGASSRADPESSSPVPSRDRPYATDEQRSSAGMRRPSKAAGISPRAVKGRLPADSTGMTRGAD